MGMKKLIYFFLIVICALLSIGTHSVYAFDPVSFNGEGTKDSPYLIENADDLTTFRDMVNDGETFKGEHFLQTVDIDLKNEDWIPIGIVGGGHYFYGVYDGGGHAIKNLRIGSDLDKTTLDGNELTEENDVGFFGIFGGTVVNLGIENGEIVGRNCGSFAYSSIGDSAAIINCYNKASLQGQTVGGIAVDFQDGVVASCWNMGILKGDTVGGVLALGGELKMYYCYAAQSPLAPDDVIHLSSFCFTEHEINSADFADRMTKNAAFAQYLFANRQDVTLMQWEFDDSGKITFCDATGYIDILGFINWYLLPLMLLIVIAIYFFMFSRVGMENIYSVYGSHIRAVAIIFGIVSVFLDTALYNKGFSYINMGNGLFLLLVNAIFIASLVVIVKNRTWKPAWNKDWISLIVLIVILVILELSQFDLVPRYDACLYYGSFVQAIDLFRIDLLTYLGAFACWKWIQGLALLIAPIEFLFPGEMFGVYISNIVITVITLVCFYWLLRKCFVKISSFFATLGCAVLIFSPYGVGMFTYLCMDWHTPFFLVWLLCAYLKKNNLLISFCGFLLAFNKISGLVFYVFFLISATLIEVIRDKDKAVLQRLKDWWNWPKVFLWILPGVLFLIFYFHNFLFEIQNFYGSNIYATISLMCKRGIANTMLQSFVFGFRWLFVLLFLIAMILLVVKRRNLLDVLNRDGVSVFISVVISCIFVFVLLIFNNSDAECPRYTTLFNLFYAFSFVVSILIIFQKEIIRRIFSIIVLLLLIIQTFWTIDPSIILTCDSIDTGKKQIYKLALPGDIRPGMNIGSSVEPSLGDLYAYNLEYTFYDDLLDQALTAIPPLKNDAFYSLDILYYEWHLYGNHYDIFWNTRLKKRTYDGQDYNSIYFEDHRDITTEEICSFSADDLKLANSFYLLVADRIDPQKAIFRLKKFGYEMTCQDHLENIYGKISVYKFEK